MLLVVTRMPPPMLGGPGFPPGFLPMGGMVNNGVYDEYAGLMTQREKDWIVKLQLMQLTSDNPYIDDFYYTVLHCVFHYTVVFVQLVGAILSITRSNCCCSYGY